MAVTFPAGTPSTVKCAKPSSTSEKQAPTIRTIGLHPKSLIMPPNLPAGKVETNGERWRRRECGRREARTEEGRAKKKEEGRRRKEKEERTLSGDEKTSPMLKADSDGDFSLLTEQALFLL